MSTFSSDERPPVYSVNDLVPIWEHNPRCINSIGQIIEITPDHNLVVRCTGCGSTQVFIDRRPTASPQS